MAVAANVWPWLLTTALTMLALQLAIALRALRYWQRRHVPCAPSAVPFVGHFAAAALGRASEHATVRALYAQLQGEPFAGVYLGRSPALLLREPALVKAVLSDHFDTFPARTATPAAPPTPLSRNVFNAEGAEWRDLRQRLTPNFTPGRTRRALPALLRHAHALVRALRTHASRGDVVALKAPLMAYAVDGVAETLFGLQAHALADPADPLLQMALRVEADCSAIHQFVQLATPRVLKVLRGTDAAHTHLAHCCAALARDVVAARAAGGAQGRDFVQLLTRSHHADDSKDEAERRLAAHMCCMLYAGAHKPSALASCALAELAAQPELQEQLRAEVSELLEAEAEAEGEGLNLDALEKAPLLDAVVLETLRLHPAEPVLTRVSRSAWALPGSGVVLEAGTRVLLPVAALQRDPALFARPDAFEPRRFLPAGPSDASAAPLFLPFGLGPRQCVGYRVGLLQVKVALAALLASYRFAPHPTHSRSHTENARLRVTLL